MSQAEFQGELIRPSLKSLWAHWVVLAVSVVLIAIPDMVLGLGQRWLQLEDLSLAVIGLRAAGALGIFYAGIIRIGYIFLANRYYLTDQEVIEIYGLIQRQRRATRFEHIRRVSVEVGFVGRVLGYGDVLYYTSGSGDVDVRLHNIPNPEELAERVKLATESAESQSERSQAQAEADQALLSALNALTDEISALRKDQQTSRDTMQALNEALDAISFRVQKQPASRPVEAESVEDVNPAAFTVPRDPGLHAPGVSSPEPVQRTIDELAKTAMRGSGCSHDVYVCNFSRSVDALLATTEDPSLRETILDAASKHDYHTPEEVEALRQENVRDGFCVHGIDPDSCPAGCGDID